MKKYITIVLLSAFMLPSCMNEPQIQPNTYEGNFNSLWNIIDSKYCYLDYKKINWDSIHSVYQDSIANINDDVEFFDLMGGMLGKLKDGHVNLYSNFDKSRYWKWYTDYPSNFNSTIIYSRRYLGDNYRIAGNLRYALIDRGNVGYIYYGSFADGFTDNNMSYVLSYFRNCKGIILDVRDNGGGSISYSEQLASYFFTKTTVTGYIRHKKGAGHSDFSEPVEIKTPAHKTLQWQRPVIVLTNRMSFSATNDFVNRMQLAPNARVVGDKTGGGGGLPLSSELPNGWMVRFSACPMFDSNMQHTEWGLEPDVWSSLNPADESKDIDTIIETAVLLLK